MSLDTGQESQVMANQTADFPGELDFPLLSDVGHQVVDLYGIYNPVEVKPGIPYPVTYVINKEGVVTRRFFDAENFTRPTDEQVREELKKIGALR